MADWTREELLTAFETFRANVQRCVDTGDWSYFVDSFTPDATYVEHAYGRFAGHEEIDTWVKRTMGAFPGNEMTHFPANWVSVDVEKGWVFAEIDNPMRDPGDGTRFAMANVTILRYAGGGKWREEEDVYNPMEFFEMAKAYVRHCHSLGTLSADGAAWAQKFGVTL
ncbi:MAG: nuclear transport factor 2 family protein [Nocardioides sp.]|uniref:nuclear transport factor 2 family protein n=1 Tax=Nocardioides sp. TaxID=35761 RepID=UPI003F07290B